ncbi:MAG: hypothetical protein BWZ07_03351 [Alphaproteobacteria bacterium ADurb.BinA280]|nr:MAG: hypothetical protein BWZ07_03351 [Alphaproteobacteria bacterium ADurb.BinA280]
MLLKCRKESSIIHLHQQISFLWRHGEHDRIIFSQWQECQRAIRRKAFPGTVAVRWLRAYFGEHGVLMVVANRNVSSVSGSTFGMNDKLGVYLLFDPIAANRCDY